MKKLEIYIFHYHLLPGGVTDVIIGWLRILAKKILEPSAEGQGQVFPSDAWDGYEKIVLRVCCGRPENITKLQRQCQDLVEHARKTHKNLIVEFLVDSELGYRSLPDSEIFAQLPAEQQARTWQVYVRSLVGHLLLNYCDPEAETLWWVHNFHLGKNIAYTHALIQIIQGQIQDENLAMLATHIKFLLHIHDFPECGRFTRYRELLQAQKWLHEDSDGDLDEDGEIANLYPICPNVCYGTINKRDYQVLCDAGLPQVYLLPNPLEFRDLKQWRRQKTEEAPGDLLTIADLQKSLGLAFAGSAGRYYDPAKPIMLYPVRCIRRKNILELALLNLLSKESWNLVSTLPGCSAAEKPYSDMIESLYHKGLIPGLCHIGTELEQYGWSFEQLCSAASLIASSSVMEGFGFTYFNPIYWGKPLLARKLNVLQGFEHCFPEQQSHFYHKLQIPLHSPKTELVANYYLVRRMYSDHAATLPKLVQQHIREDLERCFPAEPPPTLDFALFPVGQQQEILHLVHQQPQLSQACCEANRPLLERLKALRRQAEIPEQIAQQNRQVLAAEFAPGHLAQILLEAWSSISFPASITRLQTSQTRSKTPKPSREINEDVLKAFSKLEYNYAILWDRSWIAQPAN